IKVFVAWHQAKRCFFHIARATTGPLDDPLQHAHVLAKSRPHKSALRVAPKPVDAEDLRRMLHSAAHVQPVSEIVAHVIATEREHRHRIAPHDAHLSGNRGGRFGAERGRHIDTLFPAGSLDDEWYRGGARTTENESRNGNALRILPFRLHRRT